MESNTKINSCSLLCFNFLFMTGCNHDIGGCILGWCRTEFCLRWILFEGGRGLSLCCFISLGRLILRCFSFLKGLLLRLLSFRIGACVYHSLEFFLVFSLHHQPYIEDG